MKGIHDVFSNLLYSYFKLARINHIKLKLTCLEAYYRSYMAFISHIRLLFAYRVLVMWVRKDKKIYKHMYAHIFQKIISVNQVYAHIQPSANCGHSPGSRSNTCKCYEVTCTVCCVDWSGYREGTRKCEDTTDSS